MATSSSVRLCNFSLLGKYFFMTFSINNQSRVGANGCAGHHLIDVNENKKYSHNVINKAFNKYKNLNRQDRAFISRLVHGTLERQLSIDYIISLYSKVKVSKIKNVILQILRLSIYQIMYMDKIPDSAACNKVRGHARTV